MLFHSGPKKRKHLSLTVHLQTHPRINDEGSGRFVGRGAGDGHVPPACAEGRRGPRAGSAVGHAQVAAEAAVAGARAVHLRLPRPTRHRTRVVATYERNNLFYTHIIIIIIKKKLLTLILYRDCLRMNHNQPEMSPPYERNGQ